MNHGSLSTVRIIGCGSGVCLKNASCKNALCPKLSSAEEEFWSGDVFPGSAWDPWSQLMVDSAPKSAEIFRIHHIPQCSDTTVYFLHCGSSTGWIHVTFEMTTSSAMLRGLLWIGIVKMRLIDWTGLPRARPDLNWKPLGRVRSATTVQNQWRNLPVFSKPIGKKLLAAVQGFVESMSRKLCDCNCFLRRPY